MKLAHKLSASLVALAALAGASTAAQAAPITLSWGFIPIGNTTVVPAGDIAGSTTQVVLPATLQINTIAASDAANAALANIALGGAVGMTPASHAFALANGPLATNIVISAGLLTYTFTSETNLSITGTGPLGSNVAGNISLQLVGTITGATGAASGFLGQTALMSESCTQTTPGAAINCSLTVDTPSSVTQSPEPASLAIMGAGLFGLASIYRRRRQG